MDVGALAVVLVGPGRVGTTIAARLAEAGVDARLTRDPADAADAGCVLLTVPDDAIAAVARAVPGTPWLGCCSGATPLAALGDGPRRFVLHPAQMIVRDAGPRQLDGVTAFATGASDDALAVATALARRIGMRPVALAESVRPLPHVACAIASNYLVALEATAVGLLERAGLARDDAVAALRPLVEGTVARTLAPAAALVPTGPIARGDAGTIARHLDALAVHAPELVALYRTLGAATLPLVDPAAAERARLALGLDGDAGVVSPPRPG